MPNPKLPDIGLVFFKNNKNLAKNNRSISILPPLSKVFEKIM